ncbi:CHAT domain-containing protein [Dactylonectria estremocensis]|uniref:CHAT domain-containing protein n=1 Tax=Dactylonectria estremocensis TaxID=1079267 RepID=A0A9P9D719_9HYPO|nr:CHAT domain-containing protein [Dactylonectria estremocensis]
MTAYCDCDENLQRARKAVLATPDDDLERAGRLFRLGMFFHERYRRTHLPDDLEEAIQFFGLAVPAIRKDDPQLTDCLIQHAGLLNWRYWNTRLTTHLDEAILGLRKVVDDLQENDLEHGSWLVQLGWVLEERSLETGEISELDEAIECMKEGIKQNSDDWPLRAPSLYDLNHAIWNRYLKTRATVDFNAANLAFRQANEAMPNSDPLLHWQRVNSLGRRLLMMDGPVDADEAILMTRQAVEEARRSDPDQTLCFHLMNLGDQLVWRIERAEDEGEVDEIIQIRQQVIKMTPSGHRDRACRLQALAAIYQIKYSLRKTICHLTASIRLYHDALELTPASSPFRPMWLYTLGLVYEDRNQRTKSKEDLEKPFKLYREALEAMSSCDPDRHFVLRALGLSHFRKASTITSLLLEAANHPQSPVSARLRACGYLLDYCERNPAWKQSYGCACMTVDLLQSCAPHFLETSDKQINLRHFDYYGLACSAATVALESGKGALKALQLLERGRGLLSASLENVRMDSPDLRKQHPDLAERFLRLRSELQLPMPTDTESLDERVERRQEVAEAFNNVLAEIRQLPGFENFQLPPSEAEIYSAAQDGPVVVILVCYLRSYALLIERHQVRALPLSNLKTWEAETRRDSSEDVFGDAETLEWLWDTVAAPVLHALGFTQPPADDNWPHVWWIPTNVLSHFPIHAAGYHCKGKQASQTVLDRVISSYSPSIKAIVNSRRRPVQPATAGHALLVGIENASGYSRLPFANKEISVILNLCKSLELNPLQPGRSKPDIVPHLGTCSIFHFAGHGYSAEEDPAESFLALEDGPLKVAELLDMNLQQHSPFLAFLSACGTGRSKDQRLLDENINLISAFQLAGFRHVIGTLWNVDDEVCVDIARITYEGMRDEGLSDTSICRGLHRASRLLRDRWVESQKVVRGNGSGVKQITYLEDGIQTGGEGADVRGLPPPRDVLVVEEDKIVSASWVPYVHFGV